MTKDDKIQLLWKASRMQQTKNLAMKLTGVYEAAKDLIQDTLLHCLERIDQFDGRSPGGFFCQVMRNNSSSAYHKSSKMPLTDLENAWFVADNDGRFDPMFLSEQIDQIADQELTPKEQRILAVLRTGASYDQIQQQLCLPMGTVKQTIGKLRRKLARSLTEAGYEDYPEIQRYQ